MACAEYRRSTRLPPASAEVGGQLRICDDALDGSGEGSRVVDRDDQTGGRAA
jgi:hypothetical protein